jgi:tetratricopeptide (TPR) repeat protein
MHYRLGTISLATTTLLLSLTSPLLALGGFELLAVQTQTTQDQKVGADSSFQTGVEQFNRGQLPEALATFGQVLAKSREQGDKLGEAEALSGIGEVYIYGLHPRTEALNVLQEALAIYQKLEDSPQTQFRRKQGEARAIALTGLAYDRLNRKDEALKNLQHALSIQREIGDKAGVGQTVNYIASLAIGDDSNSDPNRLKEALELLKQALAINREVGNSSNEIVSLGLLGWGHNRLGNNEQALKFLNEALAKSQENGYRLWEGQVLALITLVYTTQGNMEQALASGQQALSILEAIGGNGTNNLLFVLGSIYLSQQQYSEALDSYKRSLAITQQIRESPNGDSYASRTSEGDILNLIGGIYFIQQDYKAALNASQQALTIHREVENRNGELTTLLQLGKLYRQQKQFQEALNSYQQSLTLSRSLGSPQKEGETLSVRDCQSYCQPRKGIFSPEPHGKSLLSARAVCPGVGVSAAGIASCTSE